MKGHAFGSQRLWTPSNGDACALNDAMQAAIAEVLGAERDAREAIARARLEVKVIDEDARAAGRRTADRTDQRMRAVADASERQLSDQLAAIDAEATRLDIVRPLTREETEGLQRALQTLTRNLIGVQP